MNKVAVFGSLNMDILVTVPEFPLPGKTVNAKSIDYKAGGKGISQAAAAAAVKASTILIGSVGQDVFGQQLIAQIDRIENLDGSLVNNIEEEETGLASKYLTDTDRMSAYINGANNKTDEKRAEEVKSILQEADVLVCQFQTPLDGIKKALSIAYPADTLTVLNPSPYKKFDKDFFNFLDILTLNLEEFTQLADDLNLKEEKIEQRMLAFQKTFPNTRLIVTKGKEGLSYIEAGNIVTLNPIKVNVVDEFGAGDTFTGVLAGLLSQEVPFEQAVAKASVAAGLSTQKKGGLGSAPKLEEIDLFLSKDQAGADENNY